MKKKTIRVARFLAAFLFAVKREKGISKSDNYYTSFDSFSISKINV